nr:low temperature requirement protein A [Micromonospora sp. DSM 115978]
MGDSGPAEPVAAGRGRPSGLVVPAAGSGGVHRLELFLDLVFVYAFLNVSNLLMANHSFGGLFQAILVVLLIWRSWTACAWLGNIVRLDLGAMPLVVFAIAALVLLIGVAGPVAFADGLVGPLVFVVGFILVRASALFFTVQVRRDGTGERRRIWPAAWPLAGSAVLLLGAALLPPDPPAGLEQHELRVALFCLAVVVDFAGLRALGTGIWQIASTRHWAERHSLIILVAFGETILSVGISNGLDGRAPITWPGVAGSLLSIVVVVVLWWTYFDIARPAAERALESAEGSGRSVLGRDAYSLAHLPMIGGLILLAFGLKHALMTIGKVTSHPWEDSTAALLFIGVVLYLGGLIAFEWRTIKLLGRGPLLGAALMLVLIPVAARVSALGALALLAAGVSILMVADLTVFRGKHSRLHAAVAPSLVQQGGVTPRELFVDLVFVYAFIQVTVLMTREGTPLGVVQGVAVLALLWWAWCGYTRSANAYGIQADPVRATVLGIVAFTLVMSIATPQSFGLVAGGLPGPIVVVVCYLLIRVSQVGLMWRTSRLDPERRRPTRVAAISGVAVLLLAGSAAVTLSADGSPGAEAAATGLWVAAVAVEFVGSYPNRVWSWRIRSVGHWTDRYALIMLIALGEVIIATGVSADGQPITGRLMLAALASTVALCSLWWSYFDSDLHIADRAVRSCAGADQSAIARDAYAYLHLPMVAGLMVFAFGLRETLSVIHEGPNVAPTRLGHYALYFGVVGYLLANQAFWWRTRRKLGWYRVSSALLLAVLTPFTTWLPAPWTLVLLAVMGASFATLETLRSADRRGVHRFSTA